MCGEAGRRAHPSVRARPGYGGAEAFSRARLPRRQALFHHGDRVGRAARCAELRYRARDRAGHPRIPRRARRGLSGSLGIAFDAVRGVVGAARGESQPRSQPLVPHPRRRRDRGGRAERGESKRRWIHRCTGRAQAVAWQGLRQGVAPARVPRVLRPWLASHTPRGRRGEPDRRDASLRAGRHARRAGERRLREGACVSALRAKCPTCKTLTAVAIGDEYQCHSCGRTFAAGMVRVPRAWGDGGVPMIESASLPLDYPEAAVIEEATLDEQNLALAPNLPARPLVLGGCCCSHVGAVEGLAARHERLGVVWFDAHGDLNTPEPSPSGNTWVVPRRMVIASGAGAATDVALIGARNLDPPEVEFIERAGVHDNADAVLANVDCVYVALDVDVFEPSQLAVFMPEPDGPTLADVERQLMHIRESGTIVGAGLTGLAPDPQNVEKLERLTTALGW